MSRVTKAVLEATLAEQGAQLRAAQARIAELEAMLQAQRSPSDPRARETELRAKYRALNAEASEEAKRTGRTVRVPSFAEFARVRA